MQQLLETVRGYDAGLYRHSLEVALLSSLLARQVGLPEREERKVKLGGLLHDVGKTRLDRQILNKPGALDEQEWQQMRQHPLLGAEILNGFDDELLSLVRLHHERWDGSGYLGLQGEEIPLGARIITLADAFSAMNSERPYHRAKGFWEALEEVQKGKGRQFDPELARAFLQLPMHQLALVKGETEEKEQDPV